MDKKNNNKLNEMKSNRMNKEEYGYDFVPELSHVLNIDEQRDKAIELEKLTRNNKEK